MKLTLTRFLLVACISVVASELCPPSENISPCTCHSIGKFLSVSCDDLGSSSLNAMENIVRHLSGVKNIHLELSRFNLDRIPSKIFNNLDIYSIVLNSCFIESLLDEGDASFIGLEDKLKELHIKNSIQIPFGNDKAAARFGHLRQLRELDARGNKLTHLNNEWFRGGPHSLEYLDLSENDIYDLGNLAFAELSNVETIDLSTNSIERLQRFMFPYPARKLTELGLAYNGISSLPVDIFSQMPVLSKIHLNGNEILALDERTWSPIWKQIDTLNFQGNPLNCDSGIDWIFKSERQIDINIFGKCESPEEKKGKYLHELGKKE